MLRKLFKTLKWLSIGVVALVLILVGTALVLYWSADMGDPDCTVDLSQYPVQQQDSVMRCGGSTLRWNPAGLWELTTGGDAVTRGAESGALLRDLMHYQEQVFVDQIHRIVPSDRYLSFLKVLITIFNRNLGEYVPEENRLEIYAMSQSCSHEFDAIGTPYQRQLNYHAAHDIGHAMQEYMLVGCSSFAVWGDRSADSSLLVGRNFDFYVGDDFARNKLITFCRPEHGYPFASIGWPGMTGVLSGMNSEGLTITLNAAKGSIPTKAATPISILARTILQYAATIDEALAIADTTQTFVSESLLIASARDGKAAIIEKTPQRTALFESPDKYIRCTNHYQSEAFAEDPDNLENISTTDSYYRFERLGELIDSLAPLTPSKAASILRNRYGRGGTDIGLTNEKSLNQAIAHHGVIFEPAKGLMWVSTAPWQVGTFVCYDLKRIFAIDESNHSVQIDTMRRLDRPELRIPADQRFLQEDYPRIVRYRSAAEQLRQAIDQHNGSRQDLLDSLQSSNPNFWGAWNLCGNYYASLGRKEEARRCWEQALQLEIPRERERQEIERKIEKL